MSYSASRAAHVPCSFATPGLMGCTVAAVMGTSNRNLVALGKLSVGLGAVSGCVM